MNTFLFASSRGRGLQGKIPCKEIFVKPGAKLNELCKIAYRMLKSSQQIKIVYIMAGIPDICTKIKDPVQNYEECYFDQSTSKVDEIKSILDYISITLSSINCKVVFIPVTTMNIEKWNFHRLKVGKTKFLKHKSNYFGMQNELNEFIHQINNYMTEINAHNNLATPFVQSLVHKSTGAKIRYAYKKLEDGVHPSVKLIEAWIKKISKAMRENERTLSFL